jgi:uncharacterized membrane protein YbjE (DUF340 family)
METGDVRWAQSIDGAIARSSGDLIDGVLWQKLADQLLPIIGEGGFSSLYARSLHLGRAIFDWLPPDGESDAIELIFAKLQICLRGRDAVEARLASRMLLLKFITILASLIGTSLMTNIIGCAWGDDAVDHPAIHKES